VAVSSKEKARFNLAFSRDPTFQDLQ